MKKIDLIDISILLIGAGAWWRFGLPVALIAAAGLLLLLALFFKR